ncbi:MAG: hypothetical protein ABL952_00780, partial [Pyrinomonadaceae bacterium]
LLIWAFLILYLFASSVLALISRNVSEGLFTSVGTLAFNLVMMSLLFSAVSGIASRKNYGRWLAVLCFCISIVGVLYSMYWLLLFEYYSSKTDKRGLAIYFFAGIGVWDIASVLYLSLSSAVTTYFAKKIAESDPPPPPSFDD